MLQKVFENRKVILNCNNILHQINTALTEETQKHKKNILQTKICEG